MGTACKNHAAPLSALSARNGDLGVVKKRCNKWKIMKQRERERHMKEKTT